MTAEQDYGVCGPNWGKYNGYKEEICTVCGIKRKVIGWQDWKYELDDAEKHVQYLLETGADEAMGAFMSETDYPSRMRSVEQERAAQRQWATLPQCTADACQQGRKPCPSPEACMQPEPDDPFPWLTADRFWLLYLATLFILGFVAAGIAWA